MPLDTITTDTAIRLAVALERDRCAKIAENLYLNDIGKMGSRASIQQAIAAAIRNPKTV